MRNYLTVIFSLFFISCTNMQPAKNPSSWNNFQISILGDAPVVLAFAVPADAALIQTPQDTLDIRQSPESVILQAGFTSPGQSLSDTHLSIVLYNLGALANKTLPAISHSLSQDLSIISHNSDMAWHKSQGELISISGEDWLHRVGFSTGPNFRQKLESKIEDAYLLKLKNNLIVAVYVHYYTSNKKLGKNQIDVQRMLETITLR